MRVYVTRLHRALVNARFASSFSHLLESVRAHAATLQDPALAHQHDASFDGLLGPLHWCHRSVSVAAWESDA
jgi:hypothetical protein